MSWSDALSAWDEQVEVLREVNEAYQAHLLGLLEGLTSGRLDDQGFGRIERVLDLAVGRHKAAVQVRAWPTRPWGGEPGKLAVAISLDAALVEDEAFPSDLAALCKALDVTRGPVANGRVLVKRGSVPLDSPRATDQVDRAWRGALDEAPKLAATLGQLGRGSPYQWLRGLLLDVVKSGVLEESGPEGTRTSGRLMDWAGGRQFTVYGEGLPQLFFTAVPDGRLLVHFGYKRRTTSGQALAQLVELGLADAARVCERLHLRPMEVEGYAGGVLLLKNETLQAFEGDDKGEVKRRVVSAWRAYQSAFST